MRLHIYFYSICFVACCEDKVQESVTLAYAWRMSLKRVCVLCEGQPWREEECKYAFHSTWRKTENWLCYRWRYPWDSYLEFKLRKSTSIWIIFTLVLIHWRLKHTSIHTHPSSNHLTYSLWMNCSISWYKKECFWSFLFQM